MVLKKIFDVSYRSDSGVMEITVQPPITHDDVNELATYVDSIIGTGVNAQAEGTIRRLNGYARRKVSDPTHVKLRVYDPLIRGDDIILENIRPGFEPQMWQVYQRLKGVADRNTFGSD